MQNRETVLTVTGELLENPTVHGKPKGLGETRQGVVGVGQEARGGTRKTKTVCASGPAKQHRGTAGGEHLAPPSPGSWGPLRLREPGFWDLLRAGRYPRSCSGCALGKEIRPGGPDEWPGRPGCHLP